MKNNKILYAIIALLLAILCFLGGYLIGQNKENDLINSTNNDEEQSISIDDRQIIDLWKLVDIEKVLSDEAIYDGLFSKDTIIIQNSSNLIKTELLVRKLKNDSYEEGCYKDECSYIVYSSELITKKWHELFGIDSMVPNDAEVYRFGENIQYYFDSNNKLYVRIGGYESLTTVESYLSSALKNGNKIGLNIVSKFSEPNDSLTDRYYYGDYEKTNLIDKNDQISPNYKLIFAKDSNNNYYFYSIERIK